jgi:hypothetical protein
MRFRAVRGLKVLGHRERIDEPRLRKPSRPIVTRNT